MANTSGRRIPFHVSDYGQTSYITGAGTELVQGIWTGHATDVRYTDGHYQSPLPTNCKNCGAALCILNDVNIAVQGMDKNNL